MIGPIYPSVRLSRYHIINYMDNILAKACQQCNMRANAYQPCGFPCSTFPFSVMNIGNVIYFRQINVIVRYRFHEAQVSILATGLVTYWHGTKLTQCEGQLVLSHNTNSLGNWNHPVLGFHHWYCGCRLLYENIPLVELG